MRYTAGQLVRATRDLYVESDDRHPRRIATAGDRLVIRCASSGAWAWLVSHLNDGPDGEFYVSDNEIEPDFSPILIDCGE